MDSINVIQITPTYLKQNISSFLDIISDGLYEYWGEVEFLYNLPQKWESSIAISKDNIIIGFIISSLKTDSFHIHKFFIHKNYRSFGYGGILLNLFEKNIKKRFNANTISLKVYNENVAAISFYEKQGFTKFAQNETQLELRKTI
ncbi:MAG: ribosomal-protein-alanine N-acetyltransferase [Bacteroidetes bacterium ADurb.Bin217]|nr:MAG: ribosomal-protein-alanine N-acetyltransferase [Bacteroidetes bacterium ADurb.Bin217]